MKNDVQEEKKKLTLKDRLKDKRERAKLELTFYLIFFIVIIVFARISSSFSTSKIEEGMQNTDSFVDSLADNYEYDMQIVLNDHIYEYYGKVLGNNGIINLKNRDIIKSYYLMNDKYYILDGDNYILTTKEEIYPYIDYRYLNIDNIREYIKIAAKDNDVYKVKVSDLVLDSQSDKYIYINVNEGDKTIVIDYTELIKITNEDIEKIVVTITYSNIDNIISLDE